MVDKVIENNRVSIIGEIVSDFRFSHGCLARDFTSLMYLSTG